MVTINNHHYHILFIIKYHYIGGTSPRAPGLHRFSRTSNRWRAGTRRCACKSWWLMWQRLSWCAWCTAQSLVFTTRISSAALFAVLTGRKKHLSEVYVCMYVCMHECMNAWMYVCMNVWMYEGMNVWMYECMYVWICICMYISIYSNQLVAGGIISLKTVKGHICMIQIYRT